MKTERTEVTSTLYVFATLKQPFALSNMEPGDLPYSYEVKSFDWGGESSVRLHEFEVMTVIPAGIDITMKCIENLKELITKTERETVAKVAELEERIRAISLIEYKPDLEIVK